MSTYQVNEFTFELPSELRDKTHHLFTLTDEGPSPFNIVITRSSISNDEALDTYGDRLVSELGRALPQFRLSRREECIVDRQPALSVDYTWLNQGSRMRQILVSFFHSGTIGSRQVIQVSATMPTGQSDKWEEAFRKVLSSIRFRDSASPPVAVDPTRSTLPR